MPRRTKIVATLGPASAGREALRRVLQAGADVVRLNFSHGDADGHRATAALVRELSTEMDRPVGVLCDLQGPKIRIRDFSRGPVELAEGDPFAIDCSLDEHAGDAARVGCTYPDLARDVSAGDTLLLDDGQIELRVDAVKGSAVLATVVQGGPLKGRKGLNRQGGGLSAGALTDKDRHDIALAAELRADYLALSFVRSADDVDEARDLLARAGWDAGIVAKIERAEAVERLEEVIDASDAVMIARGDLGVEMGDAKLPALQKHIVKTARAMNRVVITATQMMESMIEQPVPTRAEVFDVANAVLDGTDAVMLSAETAIGRHPHKVVRAMHRVCLEAEQHRLARVSHHRLEQFFSRVDETIAMSAMYAANHSGARAIAARTASGATVRWMSRISSGIPIFAITRHPRTVTRVTLYRGVTPVLLHEPEPGKPPHVEDEHARAVSVLRARGVVDRGDTVITTCGTTPGQAGGTNDLKITRVE